jgi:tyrosyl-tRNA synthetase
MSISDEHMLRFWQLLSQQGAARINEVVKGVREGSFHPMEAKKSIAEELVRIYWGAERGSKARSHFTELFSQRQIPSDIPEHQLSAGEGKELNLLELAVSLGFAPSKGEARRVLKQNGIKLDNVTLASEKISLAPGQSSVLRYGKIKIIKLVVSA